MSAELKACPFCGFAALYAINSITGEQTMATCISCGASAYWCKWNRRTDLTHPAADYVAGLEAIVRRTANRDPIFAKGMEKQFIKDAIAALAARPASPDTRVVSVAQLEAWEADAKAFRLPTTLAEIRKIIEGGQDRG